jgi:hypothetical protein
MLVEKDVDYERYIRLRAVSKKLNLELTRRLQKKEIYRCGKDLGLLSKKTLVFSSEDDVGFLMDYCIHNPSGKKSCIDVYIEQSSFEQVSDEMMMLKALRGSFFSIFHVNRTGKGYLCYAEDILRQQNIALIDVGFGSSAVPGILIAARLMTMPASNYYMTTGAPMRIQEKWALDAVETSLRKFTHPIESGNLSNTQANSLGKQVIRLLLQQDNENTRLADPEEHEQALR